MGYIARLRFGKYELDLTNDPYGLDPMFVPPAIDETPQVSEGSMARPYQGGRAVGRKLNDRHFNLPLQISGSKVAETHGAVRRFDNFIEAGLNSADDLYFIYAPDDSIPHEPKWGQSWQYFEIKARVGSGLSSDYGIGATRATRLLVNQGLILGPIAYGKRQEVGSATGGIFEHAFATPGNISRGLIVGRDAENEFNNPIFGHSTWNNGWNAGANLSVTENTDERFVLFGSSSAKITRTGTGAQTYYESIDVGDVLDYVLSCYVKRIDGAEVTADDCYLLYGSGQTTTYTPVGDGWYRLTVAVTGVAAATSAGVTVATLGRTIFVDGFQLEQNPHVSPLVHGDMLDCAWASTAHASNSTRPDGRWRISGTQLLSNAEFTIRICWIADHESSDRIGNAVFLSDSDTNIRIYWLQADGKLYLSDGTNTASVNMSWSPNDIFIIHATAGPDGLSVYLNGSTISTNATYTPTAVSTYIYFGSNAAVASHPNGIYLDLTTWDVAITAAEALADYNNIIEHISGGDGYGQCLNTIPWSWTDDGDGTFDGCTDGTRENWGIIGGIPGSMDAKTEWNIAQGGFAVKFWIGLSKLPFQYFGKHDELFFIEAGGSADASASNSDRLAISTPTAAPRTAVTITPPDPEIFNGTVHFFVRMRHSALSGDVSAGRYISTNNGYVQDEDVICSVDTSYRLYYLGELSLKQPYNLYDALSVTPGVNFGSSLASGSLYVDFAEAFVGEMLTIDLVSTDVPGGGGGAASPTNVFFTGKQGYYGPGASSRPEFVGDDLHLRPNTYNMIIFYLANDGGTHSLTPSIGLAAVYVTPRWAVL